MIAATWNVNSINARIEIFRSWTERAKPDFILLQETKCEKNAFPFNEIQNMGYHATVVGQKAYNGVSILAKEAPIEVIETFPNNSHSMEARYVECVYATQAGKVRVISVYVPNGGSINSEKYENKLLFLEYLHNHLKTLLRMDEKVLIGGDFNVAPFDIDVYDARAVEGNLAFTLPEKKLMRSILNLGYIDAYRALNPSTHQFSWWDYRAGGLAKNEGWRIDFLLINSLLVDHLDDCIIDVKERHQEKTSDHAPVIAKFKKIPL